MAKTSPVPTLRSREGAYKENRKVQGVVNMGNFLAKVKNGIPHIADRKGVTGYVTDKVERYAAAAGFGYIKGAYREQAAYRGVPVDLLAGAAATLGAVVLEAIGSGRSSLAPHLNAVGDAGIMSYLGSMGAAYGAKSSGRTIYVLDKGAKKPSALPAGLSAVGAIPQADGLGAYLTPEQILKYSGQR